MADGSFEECKKTMQLKKKVKMKKHNGFTSENEEAKAQLVQSLTLTKIERHKWFKFFSYTCFLTIFKFCKPRSVGTGIKNAHLNVLL